VQPIVEKKQRFSLFRDLSCARPELAKAVMVMSKLLGNDMFGFSVKVKRG